MYDERRRHQRISVTPLPATLTTARQTVDEDIFSMRDDRRRYQRVAVTLPATLSIADQMLSATLRDISRSGASIELGNPLAMTHGARVVLAGNGAVLRGCDAKVVASDGRTCRLVFEPTLPAMELLGVARALGR
jgi:hypothetical protein